MGPCQSKPQSKDVKKCENCGHYISIKNFECHYCPHKKKWWKREKKSIVQNQQKKQTVQTNENDFHQYLYPCFPQTPDKLEKSIYHGKTKTTSEWLYVKIPNNRQRTVFKWVKQKVIVYPPEIIKMPASTIRLRTFQEKMLWFRLKIEQERVDWMKTKQQIRIDRGHILQSSWQQIHNKDFHKEVKVDFTDQKVDDAGGLLRQWMFQCVQEIFKKETGLFELCNTNETAYKLKWRQKITLQELHYLEVLGMIIGKALFDRISISCFFNHTLWRILSGFLPFLHDFYSFDKDMHKSFKDILENTDSGYLCLYFSLIKIFDENVKEQIPLKKNGENILVTDENKEQYIYKMILLYSKMSISKQIEALKKGLHRVISKDTISVFQPHQLQILLNGPQVIDVADWQENTLYDGYTPKDQMIKWFWKILNKFSQQQLKNMLYFCTGTNRVPVLGFKYLESNRNTIKQFKIVKKQKDPLNDYPKAYICFNRLELPSYESSKELQEKLNAVIHEKIVSFGLG